MLRTLDELDRSLCWNTKPRQPSLVFGTKSASDFPHSIGAAWITRNGAGIESELRLEIFGFVSYLGVGHFTLYSSRAATCFKFARFWHVKAI
jgi:hypothetical protein